MLILEAFLSKGVKGSQPSIGTDKIAVVTIVNRRSPAAAKF